MIAKYRQTLLSVVGSVVIAAALLAAWIPDWTGFGFDASGPEMQRLRDALALAAGMVVADVGAGKGQLTRALSRAVGPSGHVFSTEVDPDRAEALRAMLGQSELGNVTIVQATASDTGLADQCCDAIIMRRVYHHVSQPEKTNASLLRALRPGGLLAVVDMPPPLLLTRGSFGVPAQIVASEVMASGFEMLQLHRDWPGRGPLESYCALFRRPLERE